MGNDLAGKKVAFLGTGKMGGIILQALLKSGLLSPASTCATVAHEERANTLATKLGVKAGTSNVEAVKGADIIVIGVKPQVVEEVIEEISSHVTPQQLIVSVGQSLRMLRPTWLTAGCVSGMIALVNRPPVASDPVPVAGQRAFAAPPRHHGL